MKEETCVEVTLQERAEDYTIMDLREFVKRSRVFNREEKSIECDLIDRFLLSEDRVFSVCGAKGVGKTMFIRMALLKHDVDILYLPYYETRKIPEFREADVVIIDDIHYMLDDIKDGKQNIDDLVKLLLDAFSFYGGKVIFISEDVFTKDYLQSDTYIDIYPQLIRNQLVYFPKPDYSMLGCEDYELIKFLNGLKPNPRGVTAFLKNVGKTWIGVCETTLSEAKRDKELMAEITYQYRPLKIRPSLNKIPPSFPYDDFLSIEEKEKYRGWREQQKMAWEKLSNTEKVFQWQTYEKLNNDERESNIRDFISMIETESIDERFIKKLIKDVFEYYILMDQSYYERMLDVADVDFKYTELKI